LGRHLTAIQAQTFCKCPRMYYYKHIRKEKVDYRRSDIFDRLDDNARLSFLKNEKRFLRDLESPDDIIGCYKLIFDMSVATSISRSSKWITDIDHEEVEAYLERGMEITISERMSRTRGYMEFYGLIGVELADAVAYPPENIDQRIVDFKHKISNNVSIVHVEDDIVMPIQYSSGLPPKPGMPPCDIVMAKFNALLAYEWSGKEVPISSIFYTKINEQRSIPIHDTNKDEVKTFVKMANESSAYEKATGPVCPGCPFKEICENDD